MGDEKSSTGGYEGAQTATLLIGVYEGVLPFVAKIFDWHPFLAFPVRLDAPWWWIVSGVVVVLALIGLEALERGKKRVRA